MSQAFRPILLFSKSAGDEGAPQSVLPGNKAGATSSDAVVVDDEEAEERGNAFDSAANSE